LYALMNSCVLKIRFLRCYLPLTSRKLMVGMESRLECWNQLQEGLHIWNHIAVHYMTNTESLESVFS